MDRAVALNQDGQALWAAQGTMLHRYPLRSERKSFELGIRADQWLAYSPAGGKLLGGDGADAWLIDIESADTD